MTQRISQNLSSTTLFNFTEKFEYLISNLKNGFYCGDVYEKLPFDNKTGYAVPMVCFCDIPLGLVKFHMNWYGNYGIGIKRDFARQLNVNPVWYIHCDNQILLQMFKSTDHIELRKNKVLPYIKRFLGKQKNLDGDVKQKKFYDEREWRFIPDGKEWKVKFRHGKNHAINEKQVSKSKRVTYMPIDLTKVEYIIVDTADEKLKLISELRTLGMKKAEQLPTIITSTQILKDF